MKILQNKTSVLCASILLSTFALAGVGCKPSSQTSSTQTSNTPTTTQATEINKETNNTAEIKILQIAPYKKSCVGAFPMQCLVVNGDYFYDHIEGFDFEDGYSYTLKVSKTKRCNPKVLNDCPQDIGIYKYRLLKVLKKEKAPNFNQLKWTANSPKLNGYMQDFFKQQQIKGDYKAAGVDLNADGNQDYLVMLESDELCGTGGCQLLILQATDANKTAQSFTAQPFKVISENGEMLGPVQGVAVAQQQASNANHWKQLYFLYADGGSPETYAKAVYTNGFYTAQDIENN